MKLYSYRVTLADPLFFSREGVSGAFTPPYIHATALNYAIALSVGKSRKDQSYFMADVNGGQNTPQYKNSRIEKDFYLTPARLRSSPNYYTEIVKGDGDRTIQVRYGVTKMNGNTIKRRIHNEMLKAYRLYSLAPESVFEGYLYTALSLEKFPRIIRLGSFRSIAILEIGKERRIIKSVGQQLCDHPVDPLVNRVLRGVMIPMLPYPIIDYPLVDKAWEIRKYRRPAYVAALSKTSANPVIPRRGDTTII
jgi:CRISPR type I-D-associated protein Csc1